jgi:hypothetical protein
MTKNPFNAFGGIRVTRDYYHVILTEPSETPVIPEILDRVLPDESKLKDKGAFHDYLASIEIFRTKDNPAAGLIAFKNCFNAGIYPPEDLIKWLSEGIEEWIADSGNTNIEKVFRLSNIKKGNTRAIDQVALYQRNVEISNELRGLMGNFNLSMEQAANMVEQSMLKDEIPNPISTPTMLRDIRPFMKAHAETYGYGTGGLSNELKKEVLKRYPYVDPSLK